MGWVKALAISDLPFFFFKNFFEIFTPRNIVGMVDYGGEYIFWWVLGVLVLRFEEVGYFSGGVFRTLFCKFRFV